VKDEAMPIASWGYAVFAATMVAIGILGLLRGDIIGIWDSVPKDFPVHGFLRYLSACIVLACGIGLFWRRTAAAAARVLLVYLLLWLVLFKVPVLIRGFAVEVSWESCSETVVIVAGAWAAYAWLAGEQDTKRRVGLAVGDRGVRVARTLYGLALIPFGLAHLSYLKQTASLVPAWLPSHAAWATLTGCTYIAAGLAVLTGVAARLAAVLSTTQMGLFTLLVWLPLVATNPRDPDQWSETVISWTLTAAGWVIADSYRGMAWLAVGKR
jgi:uncharacterized membrane protein YphA (DoxX/SURF4 family)